MIRHLAILMAVDASNMSNGGLEVVNGSHEMKVPIDDDLCVQPEWVAQQKWTPVELEPGTLNGIVYGENVNSSSRSSVDLRFVPRTSQRSEQ